MCIYLNTLFFYAYNLNMRRMHLKKRTKCKKMYNLSKRLLLYAIIIGTIVLNNYVYNTYISRILLNFAENKVQELSSSIVTKSLNEKLLSQLDDNLFIVSKENSKIKTIDFNSLVINKIIIEALTITRDSLRENISYKIPLGTLFNNPFFNNKGPKVKTTFSLSNDLSANLNNKITPYGINSAIIETYININLTFKIIVPMSSKKINSILSIPVSIKIIEGEVPEYYLNGYNENSKLITLP